MGMSLLLKGAIVAIISGLGGITYGIVGALVLAILENSAIWYIGGEWKDAVAFLALIIILLWRPTGILKK
jgi:branched-chain amino acid transport system permease protein